MAQTLPPPDFYTGAPVDPDDLWFREAFIEQLWDALETEHALLIAPRRTGKTSVMDHLVAFPQKGFTPVSVFVQDLDHPADFILTLLDAFHDRYPDRFRETFAAGSRMVGAVLGRIQEVGAGGFKVALRKEDPDLRENWKKHGEEFFRLVRKKGERVLLVVDEFPDFILNMSRSHPELVQPFLAWFRGHRQNPRPKEDAIRWLLGGSVNLSGTLEFLGCLDKINDLREERLPALSREQVADFVEKMLGGRSVEMEDGLPDLLAERIGRPVPLFLQMITQDLYRLWKREKRPLAAGDFEKAFNDLIVSSAARDKLQHFYSRIGLYYVEPRRSAAYEILGKLALSPAGLTRDRLSQEFDRVAAEGGGAMLSFEVRQQFNHLLHDLENDFYVEEIEESRYDFASGLLKAWWSKYYA